MNFRRQIQAVVAIALLLVISTGCKKQQAKRDLIGDWTVTGYTGILKNDCSEDGDFFDEEGNIYKIFAMNLIIIYSG